MSNANTILNVAREANISLGSSNPRLFFRSMIENFNSDISDNGEESNISADFEFSMDKTQGGGFQQSIDVSIENISALLKDFDSKPKTSRKPTEMVTDNAFADGESSEIKSVSDSDSDPEYNENFDKNEESLSLSLPDSFNMPIIPQVEGDKKVETLHILDRIKHINEAKIQREQTLQYLRSFRELEANLRTEITRLNTLVDDRNFTFQNLQLSEARFRELRLKRADELTTFELACVRAMELVLPVSDALETTRHDLQHCQQELQTSKGLENQLRLELTRERRLAEVASESHKLEYASLDQRCRRVTALLESESAARRLSDDKASMHDKLLEENQKLIHEIAELRKVLDKQGETLTTLAESEKRAQINAADHERSKELMALDKTYLQNELRAAENRASERSRAAEDASSKALAADIKINQLTDQLVNLQLKSRSEFDERMERDINRLREDSQREMDALKAASREIADRENRVLRETIESNDMEISTLRRRCDALNSEINSLTKEHATLAREKGSDLSELQAELKMKSFQLTALGVTFEERMGMLRKAELELSVCNEELETQRTIIFQLKADYDHRVQELNHKLDVALSKLRTYEELETEIDNAVLRAAKQHRQDELQPGSSSDWRLFHDSTGQLSEAGHALLSSVRNAPSNPERRAKQAVYLAHKLLETEAQRDEMKAKINLLEIANKESAKELVIAKESLQLCNQPTAYVVGKLREAEKIAAHVQSNQIHLEKQLQNSEEALQNAKNEIEALTTRMKVILNQRGEIKQLTGLLELWKQQQDESQDSVDDLDDDIDISVADTSSRRQHPEQLMADVQHAITSQLNPPSSKPGNRNASTNISAVPRQQSATPPSSTARTPATSPPDPGLITPKKTSPGSVSGTSSGPSPPGSNTTNNLATQRAASIAALSSLTPDQLSRMTSRPSEQTAHSTPPLHSGVTPSVTSVITEGSPGSGTKAWYSRATIDN